MNTSSEQDIIIKQLTPFYDAWDSFIRSQATVARWLIPVQHYRWVEAFIEREATEAGILPDMFVRFESSFDHIDTYGVDLKNEFRKMVSDDRELLKEENIDLQWNPVSLQHPAHNSQYFFEELKAFVRDNEIIEETFNIYLAPKDISDVDHWCRWLSDAISMGIPNSLRIIVIDTLEMPVFHMLSEEFSEQIMTLTTNFDLDKAMQEMATVGDSTDPGVIFRKIFVDLTQAARNKDWPNIEARAKEALDLAHKQKWIHLEATVHMVVAGAFLNDLQYEMAFKEYEYAYHTARQHYEGISELEAPMSQSCGQVAIQALFGEANTLIAQRIYVESAEIYEKAAEMSAQGGYTYYELEAWRMAGFCHEQARQHDNAWEANEKALEAGNNLDEETRKGSTLPYVGQSMLRLTQKLGKSQYTYQIKDKMIEMVGADWESKIEKR